VFLRNEEDGLARLYYGTYYRKTDPRTGKRGIPPELARDMEFIRQLGGPSGQPFFLYARTVRLPQPDVGNPEWAISAADGVYSLQVAVFEPTDDFWEYKQAAADYVEWLRGQGHEAYYHHSEACSTVTVGSLGPDAVITGADGRTYYSPEVLALQRNELFKYNVVNGGIFKVKGERGEKVAVPSRLVRIPKTPEQASPLP
jgi:hypothetical protein